MKLGIENSPLNVPCPACGHEVQKVISEIHENDQITCPACGVRFSFQKKDVDERISAVEKSIEKAFSDLDKFFKK
jgi:DNA-directed RNA polymerase subunit RPC12/RpoP